MHLYVAVSKTKGKFALAEGHSPEAAHGSLMAMLGDTEPDEISYWRTDEGLEVGLDTDGYPIAFNGTIIVIEWVPGQDGYPEPEYPEDDDEIDRTLSEALEKTAIPVHGLRDETGFTADATTRVAAADIILLLDVMTRRPVTLFGSALMGKPIADLQVKVLIVECDLNTDEVEQMMGLVEQVKGSVDLRSCHLLEDETDADSEDFE